MKKTALMAAMLALAGCAHPVQPWVWRATVLPTNEPARKLEVSQMVGVDGPEGVGPARVTLADGRILKGLFRLDPPAALPTGVAREGAAARSAPAKGRIQASGNGISIICETHLIAGHGEGQCFTTTGGQYRMQI
jgi:hypothetical protein